MPAEYRTVDEYIARFPEEVQEGLRALRRSIRSAVPEAQESIAYQMPAYRLRRLFLYFAAWKDHYSLYPATEALRAKFAPDLAKHEVVKSTIHFRLDRPVPVRLVGRIAKFRAAEERAADAARPARRGRTR